MPSNYEFTNDCMILIEDRYISNEDIDCKLLSEIVKQCIAGGHEFFLTKLCGTKIKFGIKLDMAKTLPCKLVHDFHSLLYKEVGLLQPSSNGVDLYNNYIKSNTAVTDYFECSESDFENIIKYFFEAVKKVPIVHLHICQNQAEVTSASNNPQALKEATKFFRNSGKNFSEYLFQMGDCDETVGRALTMQDVRIECDDAHRIDFD